MSISLPQELLRKTSTASQETLKHSTSRDIPDESFRELLQVLPMDEKPREKDLFSLLEEEEEEKIIDGPSWGEISLQLSLSQQKKEQTERADAAVYSPSPFVLSTSLPTGSSASIQSILSPEIEAIFEKMASNMLVMSASGEVETTLFLDNPSSIFFGTKITIREFSTAPKTFNVEITSVTSAINAMESSKNDLLAAFQNGKFNFSIHRFETYIQSEESPVFHRKESSDRDNQERKGGREG